MFKSLLACAVVSMGFTTASQAPANLIDGLKPGEWYQVPNSHLRAVAPSPTPAGVIGTRGVIDAWSGGAFDSKRDRLIVWGGGHADYGGNEVYTFDLNTLAWSRTWGPSPNIPEMSGIAGGTETYADGNPVAKHTYGGLEYVPTTDVLWSQGGSNYSSGWGTTATWVFEFATSTWIRKAEAPTSAYGNVAVYDPVTKHVFHYAKYDILEYDPTANTWTTRHSGTYRTDFVSGAIDPGRRKFVVIGGGRFSVWDIPASGSMTLSAVASTGAKDLEGAANPGFAFDPVSDKYVAWSGGAAVYTLDPVTWVWTLVSPASTNTVTPTAANVLGTFGRFRYSPTKNVFVVVNKIDEDVFIYKLSAGGSPSPPPPPAPVPAPSPAPAPASGGPKGSGSGRCGCGFIELGGLEAIGGSALAGLGLLFFRRRR